MNIGKALELLAPAVLSNLVSEQQEKHPDVSEDELLAFCEGAVKHFLRKRISFAVDVVWADSGFRRDLSASLRNTIRLQSLKNAIEEKNGE